jgi:ABC-type nickel/cobalt efflux system permease component RcnA/hydrogenase/urease accessory protein HupE
MKAAIHKSLVFIKSLLFVPFSTAASIAVLTTTPASAHLVNTEVGEFYAGMIHPLTSAEHLLPTIVVALIASQWRKRAARYTLLAFPLAVLVGALAGRNLPPLSFLQFANLAVLVGLGGLLILGDRISRVNPATMGAIALLTGAILGYRSGNDMAASKVASQFIFGLGLTGLILVALVAAWVPAASSRFLRALRTLVGTGFAAAGIILLIQLVTGAPSPGGFSAWMPGQEDLLGKLRSEELTLVLVVGTLLAAMVWGAGHALTPGHGKAIVAAYLIGSKSTPRHAFFLGLTVTLTHTLGVFTLGLVALFASWYVLPQQLYPWLGAASGLLVVGLGGTMLWRRLRTACTQPGHDHHHDHEHHHHNHDEIHEHFHGRSHNEGHLQALGYDHFHSHEGEHSHGREHAHSHQPPDFEHSPVSWRYLLGLGVSGGLLPCPSALVLLLAAVSINRAGLGIALVIAFSLGLAGVLTAVGLLFVKGSRIVQRIPKMDGLGRLLPAASALVIIGIGIWLTTQAVSMIEI